MVAGFVAAIDHGTTSTRCILFDELGAPIAIAQRGQTMHYPRPGWVELDMEEVWNRTRECIHEALRSAAPRPADLAGIGIRQRARVGRPLGSTDGTPGRALDRLAGAAYAAGLATGFWSGLDDLRANYTITRRWQPEMDSDERARGVAAWRRGVDRTLGLMETGHD